MTGRLDQAKNKPQIRGMGKDQKPKEIEVTPAMVEAGVRALYESGAIENPILENDQALVRRIFETMYLAGWFSFQRPVREDRQRCLEPN